MAALGPQLAVATGDYMFVEYLPSSAASQLKALLSAESTFTAPIFHTMGNHECQSFADVNCPNLNESTNVVRHHPTPDGGQPSAAAGIAASDAIFAKHAVTLFIFGHVHEYAHLTANAVGAARQRTLRVSAGGATQRRQHHRQ